MAQQHLGYTAVVLMLTAGGIRCRDSHPDMVIQFRSQVWYMIYDIWYMIYYMIYDILYDIWYMIYEFWYMIYDIWYDTVYIKYYNIIYSITYDMIYLWKQVEYSHHFFLDSPSTRVWCHNIHNVGRNTKKISRIMAQHTVTVRMQEHLDHCVSGLRSIPMEGWFMVCVTSSFLFWNILEYFGVLILQDSLIFVVFWLVYWFIWDNSVTPSDLNAKRQARQKTLTGAARSSKSDKGAQDRPWRAEKTSTFSSFLISSFYSIVHGH